MSCTRTYKEKNDFPPVVCIFFFFAPSINQCVWQVNLFDIFPTWIRSRRKVSAICGSKNWKRTVLQNYPTSDVKFGISFPINRIWTKWKKNSKVQNLFSPVNRVRKQKKKYNEFFYHVPSVQILTFSTAIRKRKKKTCLKKTLAGDILQVISNSN